VRRVYVLFRILAYATGLLGMSLLVLGRRSKTLESALTMYGGTLLMLSFLSFLGTYLAWTVSRLTHRHR
jgi:hypothetical protein